MSGNVRKSRLGLYDQTTPLDRQSTGLNKYGSNGGDQDTTGKNPAGKGSQGGVEKLGTPTKV